MWEMQLEGRIDGNRGSRKIIQQQIGKEIQALLECINAKALAIENSQPTRD